MLGRLTVGIVRVQLYVGDVRWWGAHRKDASIERQTAEPRVYQWGNATVPGFND